MVCGGRRGSCLLYTSDAADERSSVDLGGRRIIKKKKIIFFFKQKTAYEISACLVGSEMCIRDRLMLEAKAANHAENGLRRAAWFLARIEGLAAIGSRFAPVTNLLLGRTLARRARPNTFSR